VPQVNSRYVSGPADERVYRAADAASMPAVATSGFDGAAFAWRWIVAPEAASNKMCEVILRIGGSGPDWLGADVRVLVTNVSLVPRAGTWWTIGRLDFPSVSGLDETWLTGTLVGALKLARSLA
jgi:hypothetical protein